MAWSDAARKAAAAKRVVTPPHAKSGVVAAATAAPVVQNPHLNNQTASHARGYFRQKMPK